MYVAIILYRMAPVAVASCVSQLLARAAPVTYTYRVCAEGLHFSAFHIKYKMKANEDTCGV